MLKQNDIAYIKKLSSQSVAYYDRIKHSLDKSIVCPCHISKDTPLRILDIFKNKYCLCIVLDSDKLTLVHMKDLSLF